MTDHTTYTAPLYSESHPKFQNVPSTEIQRPELAHLKSSTDSTNWKANLSAAFQQQHRPRGGRQDSDATLIDFGSNSISQDPGEVGGKFRLNVSEPQQRARQGSFNPGSGKFRIDVIPGPQQTEDKIQWSTTPAFLSDQSPQRLQRFDSDATLVDLPSWKRQVSRQGSRTWRPSLVALPDNLPTELGRPNSTASDEREADEEEEGGPLATTAPSQAFVTSFGPSLINRELQDTEIDIIDALGADIAPRELPPSAIPDYSDLVGTRHITCVPTPTPAQVVAAKQRWRMTKFAWTGGQVGMNGFFIFATWWWARYYYVFLPFITITVALNCIMVFSIIGHKVVHTVKPEKKYVPETPETLVYVLPCYNETLDECTRSLDSLVAQKGIEQHKTAIVIVCDGRVRGPGMEKTTADYLADDILTDVKERKLVRGAYTAWNTESMDVLIQSGDYKGTPYLLVAKQRNEGKRDGLILIRSFLFNYNIRSKRPNVIMSKELFGHMTKFLVEAEIENVTHLIGMDADTVFADDCVDALLEESRYKDTVGVCGYVAVNFSTGNWSPWSLYQSTEYTISQGLRRLHQSVATHKVSCLPGCCQLLRICETTCGDEVLLELFGYFPTHEDGMLKQIRATASEDRNHVCLMLSAREKAQTRQALRAKAYTDVPHSWSVFLSQRRRWSLGATSNDLYLVSAAGVQWFERIIAVANVVTWYLNPFILASIASFIVACTTVEYWKLLAFASVMIVPVAWYVGIVFWLPQNRREQAQYLLGMLCYVGFGPFLNIFVLCYALKNMDNFGWGKTRQVITETEGSATVGTVSTMLEQKSDFTVMIPPSERNTTTLDDAQNEKGLVTLDTLNPFERGQECDEKLGLAGSHQNPFNMVPEQDPRMQFRRRISSTVGPMEMTRSLRSHNSSGDSSPRGSHSPSIVEEEEDEDALKGDSEDMQPCVARLVRISNPFDTATLEEVSAMNRRRQSSAQTLLPEGTIFRRESSMCPLEGAIKQRVLDIGVQLNLDVRKAAEDEPAANSPHNFRRRMSSAQTLVGFGQNMRKGSYARQLSDNKEAQQNSGAGSIDEEASIGM